MTPINLWQKSEDRMELYLVVWAVFVAADPTYGKPAERTSLRYTYPYPEQLPPSPQTLHHSNLGDLPGFEPKQYHSPPPPPPPPPPPTLPPLDLWDVPGYPRDHLKTLYAGRRPTDSPTPSQGVHFNAGLNTARRPTKNPPLTEGVHFNAHPPPPPPPPTLSPLDFWDLPGFLPNQLDTSNAGRSLTDSPPPAEGAHLNQKDWPKLIEPFIYWSTIAAVNQNKTQRRRTGTFSTSTFSKFTKVMESVLQNIQLQNAPPKLMKPSSNPQNIPIIIDHDGSTPPELSVTSNQSSQQNGEDCEIYKEHITGNEAIGDYQHKESESSQQISEETNPESESDNEFEDYVEYEESSEAIESNNDKTKDRNSQSDRNIGQQIIDNDKVNQPLKPTQLLDKLQPDHRNNYNLHQTTKSKPTSESERDHEYEDLDAHKDEIESNNDETNVRSSQFDQIIGKQNPSIIDDHKVSQLIKATQSFDKLPHEHIKNDKLHQSTKVKPASDIEGESDYEYEDSSADEEEIEQIDKLQPEHTKYDQEHKATKVKPAATEIEKHKFSETSKAVLKNSIDNKKIVNFIIFYPGTGLTDQKLEDGSTTFTIDVRGSDNGNKENKPKNIQSNLEKIQKQAIKMHTGIEGNETANDQLTSVASKAENIAKQDEETSIEKKEDKSENQKLTTSRSKAENVPKQEEEKSIVKEEDKTVNKKSTSSQSKAENKPKQDEETSVEEGEDKTANKKRPSSQSKTENIPKQEEEISLEMEEEKTANKKRTNSRSKADNKPKQDEEPSVEQEEDKTANKKRPSSRSKAENKTKQDEETPLEKEEEKTANKKRTSSQSKADNKPKQDEETFMEEEEDKTANKKRPSGRSKAANIPKQNEETSIEEEEHKTAKKKWPNSRSKAENKLKLEETSTEKEEDKTANKKHASGQSKAENKPTQDKETSMEEEEDKTANKERPSDRSKDENIPKQDEETSMEEEEDKTANKKRPSSRSKAENKLKLEETSTEKEEDKSANKKHASGQSKAENKPKQDEETSLEKEEEKTANKKRTSSQSKAENKPELDEETSMEEKQDKTANKKRPSGRSKDENIPKQEEATSMEKDKTSNKKLTGSQSKAENNPKQDEETSIENEEDKTASNKLTSDTQSKAENISKKGEKTNENKINNTLQVESNLRTDNSNSNIKTNFLVENVGELKTNKVTVATMEIKKENEGISRKVNEDLKENKLENNSTNIKTEDTENTVQLQKPESTNKNADVDSKDSVIEAISIDQIGKDDKNINMVLSTVMDNKNTIAENSEPSTKLKIDGEVEPKKSMNQESNDTDNQNDVMLKTNKVIVPTMKTKNENEEMERVETKDVNDGLKENKLETNASAPTDIETEGTENKNSGQSQKPASAKKSTDAELMDTVTETNSTDQIRKDETNKILVLPTFMENKNTVTANSETSEKEPKLVGEVEPNKSMNQQSNDTGNQTDVTMTVVTEETTGTHTEATVSRK